MFMRKILLFLLLLLTHSLHAQDLEHGLVGFAATPAYGTEGTIGGGLGKVVRVTTEADLRKYCIAAEPYVILYEGNITLTNEQDIQVASDKTIIGLNANAVLDGIGFNANGVSNVIIRGFTIRKAHADAIAFRDSHHVWVDHCDLSDSDDGLLDFTIGSDLLTVSWNRFSNHDKVSVCNSGTQHYEDVDKQNVSYHHNSFIKTTQRNPRIGYGRGHVWNNYYESVSSYCVGYFTGARVVIEKNYFLNSKTPLKQMYSDDPASAHYAQAFSVGNVFKGCSGNTKDTGGAFEVADFYGYDMTLSAADNVPAIVKASAGPMAGLEYDLVPLPNNGRIDYAMENATLRWSKAPDAISYDVYLAMSPNELQAGSIGTVTENSVKATGLLPATTYYWRVDTKLADRTITGKVWQFTTAPAVPGKPYPADGETNAQLQEQKNANTTQPMTMRWAPAHGAAGYAITVWDEASEIYHTADVTAEKTAWQPPTLPRGRNYTWTVDVLDADGNIMQKGNSWTFTAPIATAVEGKNEAENWALGLRSFIEVQDGAWFLASGKKVIGGESGPGTMNAEWNGKRVKAKISVCMFDESDGKGTYKLFVNDVQSGSCTASTNTDKLVTHSLATVELNKGDQIRLEMAPEGGEGCRTDYINIAVTEVLPDGIEEIVADKAEDGRSYNIMGVPVDDSYKGIVIRNGKKILVK